MKIYVIIIYRVWRVDSMNIFLDAIKELLNNKELEYIDTSDTDYISSWKSSIKIFNDEGYEQFTIMDIVSDLKDSKYLKYYNNYLKSVNYDLLLNGNIHGIPHIVRSSIYTLIICLYEKVDLDYFNIILDCVFYHDIGRVNDIDDIYHGYNAIEKISFLKNRYLDDSFDIIKFVITSHCVDDDKFDKMLDYFKIKDKNLALKIVNIIKDADALDRVREYPYLDIRYLRVESTKKMVDFSYKIFKNLKLNGCV